MKHQTLPESVAERNFKHKLVCWICLQLFLNLLHFASDFLLIGCFDKILDDGVHGQSTDYAIQTYSFKVLAGDIKSPWSVFVHVFSSLLIFTFGLFFCLYSILFGYFCCSSALWSPLNSELIGQTDLLPTSGDNRPYVPHKFLLSFFLVCFLWLPRWRVCFPDLRFIYKLEKEKRNS